MKSFLVIGLGRFGKHLAYQLTTLGHEVMAIDRDESRVNESMNFVSGAQIGDSNNKEFLKSLGIRNYDVCIVTISSDFQSSLETTSNLKELGAKHVVSRAERDVQEKFLLRNGADEVIYPEKQMAKISAIRYSSEHILDYVEIDESKGLFEVTMPGAWVGKTVGEINVRRNYGINILGLKQNGRLDINITTETLLTEDKTLLVLGEYRTIQKIFRI
ncbi:MAG: TrkA family potassium uptake protein [Clostridia bacterium]|nr:TrkA family potassium uptake protein [Clostridia bacterium]MBQ3867839.1 TrkA family potassium uptake protein [Clostridia bacterium]